MRRGKWGSNVVYFVFFTPDIREKRALQDNSVLVEDPEDTSKEEDVMQNVPPTKKGNKSTKQDRNENFLYPLKDFDYDGLSNHSPGPVVKTGTQSTSKAPDHHRNPKPTQTAIGERFNDDESQFSLNEELHQLE